MRLFDWFKKLFVPKGFYCYTIKKIVPDSIYGCIIKTKVCPYWDKNENEDEQMNGYCHLLKKGDWEENGTDLLWDQVKECGINHYNEEEMEK